MTLAALTKIICLAWSAYGRPALSDAECGQRAESVLAAASRHGVDPVLMVAIDVQECDLRDDASAPVYRSVGRRRVLVGHDRCPMGVRVMDVRAEYTRAELYELAARKIERWRKWCLAGHPGGKYRGGRRHHFVAHYNPGNPVYEHQVLTFYARLRGVPARGVDASLLTPRTIEIDRRLRSRFARRGGVS